LKEFIAIMDLVGDKTVKISEQGATEITVDSGIATYIYLLREQEMIKGSYSGKYTIVSAGTLSVTLIKISTSPIQGYDSYKWY
jgi:hypothetical protein